MLELRSGLSRRLTSYYRPWRRAFELGTLAVWRYTGIDIQGKHQKECVLQIFSDLSVPITGEPANLVKPMTSSSISDIEWRLRFG